MKLAISIISTLAIIYLTVLALLYFFQRTLLFPVVEEVSDINRETIIFTNNNYDLHGWVLNPGRAEAIIYFGGNAELISNNVSLFEEVLKEYTVYLVNYRGYGKSKGEPTEQNLFSDALYIYDQIESEYQSVSTIGRSLGSGVAVYLAANRKIKKLALLTPYDSIAEVAQSHYPFFPTRYLVRDRFESIRYAPDITMPVLIVTAESDPVVPQIHSQRLREHLIKSKVEYRIVKNVAHNNIEESIEYREALSQYFSENN